MMHSGPAMTAAEDTGRRIERMGRRQAFTGIRATDVRSPAICPHNPDLC